MPSIINHQITFIKTANLRSQINIGTTKVKAITNFATKVVRVDSRTDLALFFLSDS